MKPVVSVEAPVQGAGCPCGRTHLPAVLPRVRKPRKAEDLLDHKLYAALVAGKAAQDAKTGVWWVAVHGDCDYPGIVSAHSPSKTLAKRLVRCRRCVRCRRAKANYWAMAALNQFNVAQAEGRRTWFGTLTLSTESHEVVLARARFAAKDPSISWDDRTCEARWSAVRRELVLECRRYWARLRKAGYRFKYFLVFERHLGGGVNHQLPHMHFLLHEVGGPITKKVLSEQWPWGFDQIKLVGDSKRNVSPKKAAFYVAKYLAKDIQARQIASAGYKPEVRTNCHREAKPNVNGTRTTKSGTSNS